MEEENSLRKLLDSFDTDAMFDVFDNEETGRKGFIVSWSEKGRGFGQYTFIVTKDGKLELDNECDGPEAVKRVLCSLVDKCQFLDEHE